MKQLITLTAAALLTLSLSAQYYQRAYGGPGPGCDVLRDGTPTANGLNGHLLVGHTDAFAGQDLTFTRTDNNGSIIGAPTFNNGYRFFVGATQLGVDPVEVLHTSSSRILVVGNSTRFSVGNLNEIFIGAATPGGTFFSSIGYINTTFSNAFATRACLSTFNPAQVFVVGYVNAPNSSNVRPFLICYNWQNNTTVWTRVYDLVPSTNDAHWPAAIICSPYGNEVAVVGTSSFANNSRNGFYFRADQSTGNLIQSTLNTGVSGDVIFYDNRGIDVFNAITLGSSASGGAQGYVIAGNSDFTQTSTQARPWLLKIDLDGNVLWTNELRYGNSDAAVRDVIERLNTSGLYEYYVTGNATQGYLSGDQDFLVFKCDDAGNALFEFTYNNPGFQYGVCAGLVENTGFDGLGIYGADGSGFLSSIPGDLYMIKTYFDGANACNESITPGNTNQWYTTAWPDAGSIVGAMTSSPRTVINLGPIADFPYCSTPAIAGASNARQAAATSTVASEVSVTVFPNPALSGVQELQVQTALNTDGEVRFDLVTLEGRELQSSTLFLSAGLQQTTLKIQQPLSPGIYLLRIHSGNQQINKRISIQ